MKKKIDFSIIGRIVDALSIQPSDGLQILAAETLLTQYFPQVEPTLPLLLVGMNELEVWTGMQKVLQCCYPETHAVFALAVDAERPISQRQLPLERLTDITLDATLDATPAYLFVPGLKAGGSFPALLDIVAHLRAPEGCPWDREQTLATLRHDMLDEASELLEAIDVEAVDTKAVAEGHSSSEFRSDTIKAIANKAVDNKEHIIEELGDVLLLPAMMTQIAAEEGRFQMSQVLRGIVEKLVRRHPHVFGDVETDNVDTIIVNWDAIKAQEKADRGEKPRGPLDGIPASLPALEKTRKMQSKARKAGLLTEESVSQGIAQSWEQLHDNPTESLLGEFLWCVVAWAKTYNLNAENALRTQVVKFRLHHDPPA